MLKAKENQDNDVILFNEIQLILSEKRTSLSIMRTGIAVFALPLSVLSVLIATSKYYDITHVLHLFIPLLSMCIGLVSLGFYLIFRAITRIRHYDRIIGDIKRKHRIIADLID